MTTKRSKYTNPDPRCRAPIHPETMNPTEYCWSYATHADHVDGSRPNKDYEDMLGICRGTHKDKKKHGAEPCEYWEAETKRGNEASN